MSDIFKDGSVTFPDYDREDTDNFTRKAEFTDDVFIYGNLYANIKSENITFSETTSFANVNVENIFLSGGIVGSSGIFDCLTAKNKFDVGLAGTVFTAISEADGCGSQSTAGRVGIGSTQPDGRFQVGVGGETLDPKFPIDPFQSVFIITDDAKTGIGTTQPTEIFQIGVGTDSLTFSGLGTLGIGTHEPGNFTGFNTNQNVYGALRADFDGSIRIARNIFDSAGSVGANANFLSRDNDGIRWVSFTPVETEGVFLQDEGTFVPTVGAAQSFTVLNFVQSNSNGQGTDTLIPTAQDPTTVTGVATIFTQDLWGHQGTGIGAAIYRQSRVGINQVNPLYQLDVNGDFHVSAGVQFDATLDVNGSVQFSNTLDVDGITNLKNTLESTNVNSGALVVDGGVGVEKNLNVGGSGVIGGRFDVDNVDQSTSTTTGAAVIDGGLGLAKNINIGGSGVIAGRLDVDDATDSTDTTTGALVVDGGVGIVKNLNVGQNVKVSGNLELEAQLTDFFDS